MTLVTVPSIGVVPAPIKARRVLRRADGTLVIWFDGAVQDIQAVWVEEGVEAAGFAEECVRLGDGRLFVRSAVCLERGLGDATGNTKWVEVQAQVQGAKKK